jgi:hypothetical protein
VRRLKAAGKCPHAELDSWLWFTEKKIEEIVGIYFRLRIEDGIGRDTWDTDYFCQHLAGLRVHLDMKLSSQSFLLHCAAAMSPDTRESARDLRSMLC